MESHFSSEFFVSNRQRLKQLFICTAPIVITANGLHQKGGDNAYNFSQDASFWYLTGINEPDILLVMDKGKDYLIVPSRSPSREAFDGSLNLSELKARSGVDDVYSQDEGWNKLKSRVKKVKHVATLASLPNYIEPYGFYTNPARSSLSEKLKLYNQNIKFLDLSPHVIRMRVVKQPSEIAAIQSAIDITTLTLKRVLANKKLASYKNEYEIEAELTRGFRLKGADGHAFAPIVASGQNACTLHNVANNSEIHEGDFVVVDTGAEVEHYAADITRTYVSGNKANKRKQAVHTAVQEVQDYAFGLLKPGVYLREYEQQIEQFLGEKLRELGLIKNITHELVRQYYPHSSSHFLGLNVHDVGDYEKPLEANAIITVEPGIYIKEEGIGVRVEDDVLIMNKGIKVLSSKLPRQLNLN
jgi:Xaa-Pro aminopeptidase